MSGSFAQTTWDHPRGCGEHLVCRKSCFVGSGSSPRMRGAPRAIGVPWPEPRIIPADAGSTPLGAASLGCARDHPRGCGEHEDPQAATDRCSGSSPRMRGARNKLECKRDIRRIIPADAGSTPGSRTSSGMHGDHPRGCGEHFRSRPTALATLGSSPRMRGAQLACEVGQADEGIIPADAGSTKR